jgi:hypothetical protein
MFLHIRDMPMERPQEASMERPEEKPNASEEVLAS